MNPAEILKGHFLISTPEIDSGIFFRSVVLLCEHNSGGTLGVVVNKPLDLSIPQELLELGEIANPNLTLCNSGPVQTNQLMLLHSGQKDLQNTLEVADGVFLGGDIEFLQKAVADPQGPYIKLCFGYAGWSPGQLEREFIDGSWLLHPARSCHIFHTPAKLLWRTLLQEMGGRYATLSMIPDDLTLN